MQELLPGVGPQIGRLKGIVFHLGTVAVSFASAEDFETGEEDPNFREVVAILFLSPVALLQTGSSPPTSSSGIPRPAGGRRGLGELGQRLRQENLHRPEYPEEETAAGFQSRGD